MNRRQFLAVSAAAAQGAARPNILWISCEDTSPYAFSCYGDPLAWTPNIDSVARRGVRYTHCYSVAGVCAPTRSGIITGMYPASIGSQYMRCDIRRPEFVRCFPSYLRDSGYFATNNVKTDYNFRVPKDAWDINSNKAHWRARPAGKPFFSVFNFTMTHESQIRRTGAEHLEVIPHVPKERRVDPAKVQLPPYWPDTPAVREQMANFYDTVMEFDHEAGRLLKQLEEDKLLDDTIIFIWGDHGTGLPRAKRWNYESGAHVPLVVHIPPKWRVKSQGKDGSVDDQMVSFLDLAPTVLNLAGVATPKHFQGRAFLGPNLTKPREYIYSCHDRMDERYETIRATRDKRYRYIRNYQYFKPYYQYMNTAEGSPIMEDLRRLNGEGKLTPAAARFLADSKPMEELYDAERDPHEGNNLAGDPKLRPVLERMRKAHAAWQDEVQDLGLFPEGEVIAEEKKLGNRHAILRQPGRERLLGELRAVASSTEPAAQRAALRHAEPAMRYWGATLCANRNERADLLDDPSPSVRVASAMACLRAGTDAKAAAVMKSALAHTEETIRLEAGNAVDRLGEGAKIFESELTALVADPRNTTNYPARVANRILNRIRGTKNQVR
ncbi:MAG: sulfatase [Acidobacteria bacterium]|nr:sulfatase [Acidobacteriota bacterium]